MVDLLIERGTVITMDPRRRVIDDGAVAVAGSRIVEVGDAVELRRKHRAARVIDARRKVVMPGLFDCHAHAGHGLMKTMGAGDGQAWYQACERIYTVGSSPDFWRAEAFLSALERLKCGTTCGVSLLGGGADIMRTDEPLYGQVHCEAVAEVGIRSVLAVGPCRPPFPRTFARWRDGRREDREIGFEDQSGDLRDPDRHLARPGRRPHLDPPQLAGARARRGAARLAPRPRNARSVSDRARNVTT